MSRQVSRGVCTFCQRELSKPSMSRHLLACPQRATMQADAQGPGQNSRALHLLVQGYRLPMYWLHLAVAADTTLATLDSFLRKTWLECCGHLSAFEIAGVRYYEDQELINRWDRRTQTMEVPLESVLSVGQTGSYEYDFGTTTELLLKVVAECDLLTSEAPILILARNCEPTPCDICGKPAVYFCRRCASTDQHTFCQQCIQQHPCGKAYLLRLVNSPRAGVCGYPGLLPAFPV